MAGGQEATITSCNVTEEALADLEIGGGREGRKDVVSTGRYFITVIAIILVIYSDSSAAGGGGFKLAEGREVTRLMGLWRPGQVVEVVGGPVMEEGWRCVCQVIKRRCWEESSSGRG